MDVDAKALLERRALYKARELGHTIPRIEWDARGDEGSGTCTHCADGVLLCVGPGEASITGTAYDYACPGHTCAHGWRIVPLAGGGVLLRCLHCGAGRHEG